jgi:hypothetical protein
MPLGENLPKRKTKGISHKGTSVLAEYTQKYRHRHTHMQTCRHTDKQTSRHTDIQTYRHTDMRTLKHKGKHAYIFEDIHIHTCIGKRVLATGRKQYHQTTAVSISETIWAVHLAPNLDHKTLLCNVCRSATCNKYSQSANKSSTNMISFESRLLRAPLST